MLAGVGVAEGTNVMTVSGTGSGRRKKKTVPASTTRKRSNIRRYGR
jgi:hypothetical protein